MAKKQEKKKETFIEGIKRLEEIVSEIETIDDIEEAIKLYEEGTVLSKKLEEKLEKIERKVYEVKNMKNLMENPKEDVQLKLFEEEEEIDG